MKENYHTHTWRCNHAVGTEEAYVVNAVKRGLTTLGFSDHTPYVFSGSYYSTFRMRMDQLDEYIGCVEGLRGKYKDSIRIPIGLEAEFYPRHFHDLLQILQDKPVDYLLLGQHYTNNETDGIYCGTPTADRDAFICYCKQVMDAMQTGLFTYVAHPDIINFQGSKALYQDWMRQICKESKSTGVPLELNFLGLNAGRNYPNPDFLEVVAEENCPMIFGCDAHAPEDLLNTAIEDKAIALLKKYGIALLPTTPLRSIR